MDKNLILLIDQELSKFKDYTESKIQNNYCAKFNILTIFYKLIDRYIDSKSLNDFIQQKFPNEYKLLNTKHTKFFVFLLYYYCQFQIDIKNIIELYGFIYYIVIMNKSLKYCDPKLLNLSLNKIKKDHYFRKYGLTNGILQLSNTVYNKYKSQLTECDNFILIRNIIFRLRTSIMQSTKRMVRIYYKLRSIKNKNTSENNHESIAENIFNTIMFYGYIPKIDKCKHLYDKFIKLPYLNHDLVKNSIFEIVRYFYIDNLNYQKILANIPKLKYTKVILQQLGLQITNINIMCFVYTILSVNER